MLNLTIDIGNTRTKVALFDGGKLCQKWVGEEWKSNFDPSLVGAAIVCASGKMPVLDRLIPSGIPVWQVSSQLPLPVSLDYETPQSLGADRIAAACGVKALFPRRSCVVIDAGTCITVDHVDRDGIYHGGAILPGIAMQFHALHTFTNGLPLINNLIETDVTGLGRVCGKNTHDCMCDGVWSLVRYGLDGIVSRYRESGLCDCVVCTGGGVDEVAVDGWTVERDLVMYGLNEILTYQLDSDARTHSCTNDVLSEIKTMKL